MLNAFLQMISSIFGGEKALQMAIFLIPMGMD